MGLGIKKALAWIFWGANLALIIAFWAGGPAAPEIFSGDATVAWRSLARLFGLLATFGALTQFVLMGRTGWLESVFGMDRLAIFHRRNGVATLIFILLHSSSMVQTQVLLNDGNFYEGLAQIFSLPYIWLAFIAELLFVVTVIMSILIIRKHLRFETWYAVHLLNYAAIVIVPFHQLTNGSDFLINQVFAFYWLGLYAFAALNMLIWRFGKTIWTSMRHGFAVHKIVQEAPTATSVYIKGRNLAAFRAKGGQFVLVRFLDKQRAWQEHPFSLSMLPSASKIRLTIRQQGDFTNAIPTLRPGTRVLVSGPFGAFTHEKQLTGKVVYIAGGIGITPIRSLIEERAASGKKGGATLLYANRTLADAALLKELQAFGSAMGMPIYNVLSDQPDYEGETGFVDKEKLSRLVPDIASSDVFLCGPPPMMAGVKKALRELGVPARQIHYERFALHKE